MTDLLGISAACRFAESVGGIDKAIGILQQLKTDMQASPECTCDPHRIDDGNRGYCPQWQCPVHRP